MITKAALLAAKLPLGVFMVAEIALRRGESMHLVHSGGKLHEIHVRSTSAELSRQLRAIGFESMASLDMRWRNWWRWRST